MISIRTIMIISGFMIYSAVNHSYDSKRTIKIISGFITMIYLTMITILAAQLIEIHVWPVCKKLVATCHGSEN